MAERANPGSGSWTVTVTEEAVACGDSTPPDPTELGASAAGPGSESLSDTVRRAAREQFPAAYHWPGMDAFLRWVELRVERFFVQNLVHLPVVSRWSERVGATAAGFCFGVFGRLLTYLRIALASNAVWDKGHEMGMRAWDAHAGDAALVQTHAYAGKMAAYLLEIVRQCLERAIADFGLHVSHEEKREIAAALNHLLM